MTELSAIAATQVASLMQSREAASAAAPPATNGFAQMLSDGLHTVDDRVTHADQMVRAFTLDDSVPVHEVTVALEQARISVDMAMQVRQRLVDGFREIMNMQL